MTSKAILDSIGKIEEILKEPLAEVQHLRFLMNKYIKESADKDVLLHTLNEKVIGLENDMNQYKDIEEDLKSARAENEELQKTNQELIDELQSLQFQMLQDRDSPISEKQDTPSSNKPCAVATTEEVQNVSLVEPRTQATPSPTIECNSPKLINSPVETASSPVKSSPSSDESPLAPENTSAKNSSYFIIHSMFKAEDKFSPENAVLLKITNISKLNLFIFDYNKVRKEVLVVLDSDHLETFYSFCRDEKISNRKLKFYVIACFYHSVVPVLDPSMTNSIVSFQTYQLANNETWSNAYIQAIKQLWPQYASHVLNEKNLIL